MLRAIGQHLTEDDQLYLKVAQAFDLKGSPYFIDAVAEIVNWHERRRQRRIERKQESIAQLVRLLRETDPDRIGRAAA